MNHPAFYGVDLRVFDQLSQLISDLGLIGELTFSRIVQSSSEEKVLKNTVTEDELKCETIVRSRVEN